jgi:hypothetical protein
LHVRRFCLKDGAESLCVIIAGITLLPIGRHGLCAAQPATTEGDQIACVDEHAIN